MKKNIGQAILVGKCCHCRINILYACMYVLHKILPVSVLGNQIQTNKNDRNAMSGFMLEVSILSLSMYFLSFFLYRQCGISLGSCLTFSFFLAIINIVNVVISYI